MKKSRREEMLKPVQNVEVSDKHVALRVVFFVLAVVIAIGAFAYALIAILNVPNGWMQIEASASEISAANELSFYYYVSSERGEARAEKNAVTQAYSEACVNVYRLFDAITDNGNNVRAVNLNLNKAVSVDPALYQAFKTLSECDVKLLFMAPIYERLSNIFYANGDYEAKQFDPSFNPVEKAFWDEVLTYINNPDDVSLDLLENNAVRLNVSEGYANYAEKNGIKNFVDFFHLKNAFVVDYVVDTLFAKGYKVGFVSSDDGFTRTLSGERSDVTVTLFDGVGGLPVACAQLNFKQSLSAVNLHSFKIRASEQYFYRYSDGTTVSPFVSYDGSSQTCLPFLFGYGFGVKCGDVLKDVLPLFTEEQLDVGKVTDLKERGIHTVYAVDKTVYYTQSDLGIQVNQSGEVKYEKQFLE